MPSPTEAEAQNPPIDWDSALRCRRTCDRELHARSHRTSCRRLSPTSGARGKVRSPIGPTTPFASKPRCAPASPVSLRITGPWSRSRRALGAPPSLFNRDHRRHRVDHHAGADGPRRRPGAHQHQGRTRRSPRRLPRRRVRLRLSLLAWMLGASTSTISRRRSSAHLRRDRHARSSTPALMWLTYLGLEPYIRRYSPDSILGWTRLLAGKWSDPRVGVDVIIGVSAGLAMTVLYAVHNLLPPLLGIPSRCRSRRASSISRASATSSRAFAVHAERAASAQGCSASSACVGLGLLLRQRSASAVDRRVAAMICFTPGRPQRHVSRHGTPRLDLAIGAGIIVDLHRRSSSGPACWRPSPRSSPTSSLLREPITSDLSSWHATTAFVVRRRASLALGLGGVLRRQLRTTATRRERYDFLTWTRIGVPIEAERLAQPIGEKPLVGEVELGRDVREEHERRRRDARLRGVEDPHVPLARADRRMRRGHAP